MAAKGSGAVNVGPDAMVAAYQVNVTGIKRTRAEMARVDTAIRRLRAGDYSAGGRVMKTGNVAPGISVTEATSGSGSVDIFVAAVDTLEGRIQTDAQKAMLAAMNMGKESQAALLRAATTATGLSGRSRTKGPRIGPGREDTGAMISGLTRNVELEKTNSATLITGYHGWKLGTGDANRGYFAAQEKGTRRNVKAVNSLGFTIVPVREFLKTALRALKK